MNLCSSGVWSLGLMTAFLPPKKLKPLSSSGSRPRPHPTFARNIRLHHLMRKIGVLRTEGFFNPVKYSQEIQIIRVIINITLQKIYYMWMATNERLLMHKM